MIGLCLAEGTSVATAGGTGSCWSFNPSEEHLARELVAEFWAGSGVEADVRAADDDRQVTVSSRLLACWLEHVLGLAAQLLRQAHSRPDLGRCPMRTSAPSCGDSGMATARGLVVAGGPSVVLEYGTVSRSWPTAWCGLLGDLGIVARLKVGRTAKSTADTYWLCISGAEQIERRISGCCRRRGDEVARDRRGSRPSASRPTGYRRLAKNAAWVRVST